MKSLRTPEARVRGLGSSHHAEKNSTTSSRSLASQNAPVLPSTYDWIVGGIVLIIGIFIIAQLIQALWSQSELFRNIIVSGGIITALALAAAAYFRKGPR